MKNKIKSALKQSKMSQIHIWLRTEETTTKPSRGTGAALERDRRTVLTPEGCKSLIANGFKVTVERSDARIFDDNDFKEAG